MEHRDSSQVALPPTVWRVIDYAKLNLRPKKIILFGSRACGTARTTSEVDLAFLLDEQSDPRWARFAVNAHEEPPTLYELGLVNWDEASEERRDRISREGITPYER